MIVFQLAYCSECKIQYAITADPHFSSQWILFDRNKSLERPTHVTMGGLLCLRGHNLKITTKEAVRVGNGDWVSVEREHTVPSWN